MKNDTTSLQDDPIVIQAQGSFAIGGRVEQAPGTFDPYPLNSPQAGQTCHGGHAYVQYQVPVKARKFPLVMLHGGTSFGRTWESTFDGREGYQTIFLRKGYSTYILDRPGQARSYKGNEQGLAEASYREQIAFCVWRLGVWPEYFQNVQVPRTPDFREQLFRSMTNRVASGEHQVTIDAMTKLLEHTGKAILITHSWGGVQGWLSGIESNNLAAIVAYEPNQFVFPEGDALPEISCTDPSVRDVTRSIIVPKEQFKKLSRFPIKVVYGDNIPNHPSPYGGLDMWRVALATAKAFVRLVNEYGGQAEIIELPKFGIQGNTHCAFSDLNNLEIAGLLEGWLEKHGLN